MIGNLYIFKFIKFNLNHRLESTDAVGRVPHQSPTRPDAASDADALASVPRLSVFFLGFAPTQLDSHQFGFDSRRIGLIRPESGRIGHISLYWPAIEIGRNRP